MRPVVGRAVPLAAVAVAVAVGAAGWAHRVAPRPGSSRGAGGGRGGGPASPGRPRRASTWPPGTSASPVISTDAAAGLLADTSRSASSAGVDDAHLQRRGATAGVDVAALGLVARTRSPRPARRSRRPRRWRRPRPATWLLGLGDLARPAPGERQCADHGADDDDCSGRAEALAAAHVVMSFLGGARRRAARGGGADRSRALRHARCTRPVLRPVESLVGMSPQRRRGCRRHVCARVVNPLTCDDRSGRAAVAGPGVLTWSQRKGQRTHGFQGRRDRRLPAPRCRSHRGHRDSDDQGRGAQVPRPEGRAG